MASKKKKKNPAVESEMEGLTKRTENLTEELDFVEEDVLSAEEEPVKDAEITPDETFADDLREISGEEEAEEADEVLAEEAEAFEPEERPKKERKPLDKSAPWYLVTVLTVICTSIALLLAVVNDMTKDIIAENAQKVKNEAVLAVFPEGTDVHPVKTDDGEEVYVILKDGEILGYCVNAVTAGYAGDVSMMIGVNGAREICGIRIVSMGETPGVGTKIGGSTFLERFFGRTEPVTIGENVDGITGATYSSKAVAAGVNHALDVEIDLEEVAAQIGADIPDPNEDPADNVNANEENGDEELNIGQAGEAGAEDNPIEVIPAETEPKPETEPETEPEPEVPVVVEPTPEPEPEVPVVVEPTPEPEPEIPVVVEPMPEPEPEIPVVVEPTPEPEPEVPVVVEPTPEPEPEIPVVVEPMPEPEPEVPVVVEPMPEPEPEIPVVVEPTPEPEPEVPVVVEPTPEPEPEVPVEVEPTPEPEPEVPVEEPEPEEIPEVEPTPEPEPEPEEPEEETEPPKKPIGGGFIKP